MTKIGFLLVLAFATALSYFSSYAIEGWEMRHGKHYHVAPNRDDKVNGGGDVRGGGRGTIILTPPPTKFTH